jgi:hypothetical protein
VKIENGRWTFEWNDPDGDLQWVMEEYRAGKIGTDDL